MWCKSLYFAVGIVPHFIPLQIEEVGVHLFAIDISQIIPKFSGLKQ